MFKWIGSKSFKSQKGNQIYMLYIARLQVDGVYEALSVFVDEQVFMKVVSQGFKIGEDIKIQWDYGNRIASVTK